MNKQKRDRKDVNYEIFWEVWEIEDPMTRNVVKLEGWSHTNHTCAVKGFVNPVGIFDSYVSAMADAMGLWDDYCEYHRLKSEEKTPCHKPAKNVKKKQ